MRSRRPPRRTLTPDAIVDAAMAVLDEGGVDSLSMRAVADRLCRGLARKSEGHHARCGRNLNETLHRTTSSRFMSCLCGPTAVSCKHDTGALALRPARPH